MGENKFKGSKYINKMIKLKFFRYFACSFRCCAAGRGVLTVDRFGGTCRFNSSPCGAVRGVCIIYPGMHQAVFQIKPLGG